MVRSEWQCKVSLLYMLYESQTFETFWNFYMNQDFLLILIKSCSFWIKCWQKRRAWYIDCHWHRNTDFQKHANQKLITIRKFLTKWGNSFPCTLTKCTALLCHSHLVKDPNFVFAKILLVPYCHCPFSIFRKYNNNW